MTINELISILEKEIQIYQSQKETATKLSCKVAELVIDGNIEAVKRILQIIGEENER